MGNMGNKTQASGWGSTGVELMREKKDWEENPGICVGGVESFGGAGQGGEGD